MKIFDRYIILNFLKNYLLSFLVLVGLYVALDLVFHFDELTRGLTMGSGTGQQETSQFVLVLRTLGGIVGFYMYQPFLFFVQLSGVIPVVAVTFTLMRMTRFNEMTAMLASGVPMLRIAAPVIVAGMAMSALVVVDEELIIPHITSKLVREHEEANQMRTSSFQITMMEDGSGNRMSAARYTPPGPDASGKEQPARMLGVDVIEFDSSGKPAAHVKARSAVYDHHGHVWHLTDGQRQTGLQGGEPRVTPVKDWHTDIGPDEITLYRHSSYMELLSTSQINGLLAHPRNYGTVPLLRVKYSRFIQPIANIVLLLLAIPCVLTREPGTIKMAATRTVLITGACMGALFLAHQLAGRPPSESLTTIWPALVMAMPIFVFAPFAVWQLDRVKT